VSWKLRRAFALFAYLASSPDLRAGRDELMEAGWPDADEATVERNFHPTLSHLRRSLAALAEPGDPPVLLHGQGVYRLNRRYRWQIDTVELAALAARGRTLNEAGDAAGAAAAWQAAWALYKGPFLDGYYSPWVEERREALSLLYQDVLRRLGDLYDDTGRHQQALDAYRAVLAADPLEERVHRAIMRLYARQGRRDLTRLQYDRLTSLLRRELGVEPLPETTSEYHRLMG
jgi:DNA-binding SARP family transcriptional activator